MNNNHIYSYKKIDHERDQLPVLRLRDEPKTEQGNDNWNEDDEGEGDHKVMIVEDGEDDIAVVMEVPLIHPVTSPTPPPPPTSASHSGFVKANAADWKSIFAFKGSIGGNATEEGKKIIGPRVKKRSPNKNNNKKSNLTSSTSSSSSRMKSSPAAAVPYSSTTTSATRSGHAQPDLLQKSQLRMGLSASFAYKSKGGGGGGMKL